MTRRLLLLALLATRAAAEPVVLWASDPVRPGETALVFGDGFATTKAVEVVRLHDDGPGRPPPPGEVVVRGESVAVKPLQVRRRSVKFVIPDTLAMGVYACRIVTADGEAVGVLNRPTALWLLGDEGTRALPLGLGWVRVFGRCLAVAGRDPTLLLQKGDDIVRLKPEKRTPWSLQAQLPSEKAGQGRHKVYVHNGCGGPAGWSAPLELTVPGILKLLWPGETFNVRDFGARGDGRHDDTPAVLAALEKARENRGGSVYFPRGRYKLVQGIELPPYTTLEGESRELVTLFWPDMDEPPDFLVHGKRHFVVQNLTFYCTNYVHFLGNDIKDPEAGDVHVRKVRFRGVIYRGHLKPDAVNERFEAALKRSTGGGDTLRLRGSNITVEDCDLYGSGRSLFLLRGRGCRIARNKLYNGRWGWYCISGADGVVLEDNEIVGGDLMSTGGGINCLYGATWSQNVYYAGNKLRLLHGWDREAMTSDAGGGVHCGTVTGIEPDALTLPMEPKWGGRDWTGAGVFILDGKGMGQYRRIARYKGRRVWLDEPWTIVPDEQSIVSVTMLQRNYLFVGNRFEDAGVAIQLYGMSVGHVMAGNVSARTGGFHNIGMRYTTGYQPSWFNQWLGNTIEEGNVYQGGHNQHKLSAEAHLGVFAFPPSGDWTHPLTLCTIVRGNRLLNNAHIALGGTDPGNPHLRHPLTQEIVCEHNVVKHADVGIWVRRATEGVLLRENTFEDVRDGVLDDETIERRREAERAKLRDKQEPVAHWSFDEAADDTVPDQSGNGFHARVQGTVTLTEGVRGKAAAFDGKSHLVVGNGHRLHLPRVTLAAWIRPSRVEGRQGIIAKRTAHAAAPFVLTVRDGRLSFEATEADGRTWSLNFASPPVVQPGVWQHVAAVVDEGKGVTLYHDGKPVATKESAAKLAQNDLDLWIGKEAWGAVPGDASIPGYFTGAIDDVTIWSRALSEDELRAEAERN